MPPGRRRGSPTACRLRLGDTRQAVEVRRVGKRHRDPALRPPGCGTHTSATPAKLPSGRSMRETNARIEKCREPRGRTFMTAVHTWGGGSRLGGVDRVVEARVGDRPDVLATHRVEPVRDELRRVRRHRLREDRVDQLRAWRWNSLDTGCRPIGSSPPTMARLGIGHVNDPPALVDDVRRQPRLVYRRDCLGYLRVHKPTLTTTGGPWPPVERTRYAAGGATPSRLLVRDLRLCPAAWARRRTAR